MALPAESGRAGGWWPWSPPLARRRSGLDAARAAARPRLTVATFVNGNFARSCATIGGLMFGSDFVAQRVCRSLFSLLPSEVRSDPRYVESPGDLGALDLARGTVREPGSFDDDGRRVDLARAAKMGAIGCVSAGPLSFWTYQLCAHLFPGVAWRQVGKRVVAILALTMPVSISSTFALSTLLGGGTPRDAAAKISRDLRETWMANTYFWPPILVANLRWVRTANQASVGAVAHAVWNVYLSLMTNK